MLAHVPTIPSCRLPKSTNRRRSRTAGLQRRPSTRLFEAVQRRQLQGAEREEGGAVAETALVEGEDGSNAQAHCIRVLMFTRNINVHVNVHVLTNNYEYMY